MNRNYTFFGKLKLDFNEPVDKKINGNLLERKVKTCGNIVCWVAESFQRYTDLRVHKTLCFNRSGKIINAQVW